MLDFATVVDSDATRTTHQPSSPISTAARPTMISVNDSWYCVLMSRFFQLRLYARDVTGPPWS